MTMDISGYLTGVNKAITDRTDLILMLKSDKTVNDTSAQYSVSEGTSLTVNETTNVITVFISTFASLVVGTRYYIGLGIKFTGDSTYREIPIDSTDDSIIFTQDVIRG